MPQPSYFSQHPLLKSTKVFTNLPLIERLGNGDKKTGWEMKMHYCWRNFKSPKLDAQIFHIIVQEFSEEQLNCSKTNLFLLFFFIKKK